MLTLISHVFSVRKGPGDDEGEPELDTTWDSGPASEQGNIGEDTGDSGSPDYGADKD